jgi:alkylhydroperoxidase family enzyme
MQGLHDAVLATPGALDPASRLQIASGRGGPDELRRYAEKVALHAYRVTDADVDALRAAGFSDAAIFEATVCAALGAGLLRRDVGIAALEEAG